MFLVEVFKTAKWRDSWEVEWCYRSVDCGGAIGLQAIVHNFDFIDR